MLFRAEGATNAVCRMPLLQVAHVHIIVQLCHAADVSANAGACRRGHSLAWPVVPEVYMICTHLDGQCSTAHVICAHLDGHRFLAHILMVNQVLLTTDRGIIPSRPGSCGSLKQV